ncbi:MAG: ATP-binding protein [Acidobacteriota bacterium]
MNLIDDIGKTSWMNPAGILSTDASFANFGHRAIIGFVQACNRVSPLVALFNLSCLGELMIKSIQFKNFRALRDTRLPLNRFTLIIGPNGSGKSTALKAIEALRDSDPGIRIIVAGDEDPLTFRKLITVGAKRADKVEITINWGEAEKGAISRAIWESRKPSGITEHVDAEGTSLSRNEGWIVYTNLRQIRVYSLDAQSIASSFVLEPNPELYPNGSNLVGVLDHLRDNNPERFYELNETLGTWLPEFDQILFETPKEGHRSFLLRTRRGQHKIPAADISQGTLLVLAMLTLAYLPNQPSMVCLEEPDRGIHPRLLRDVQDALYRLSYPENYGEDREPVQVIATTHSPYFLDLYRDHPEEVVIANKTDEGTKFERLSDQPYLEEILLDSHLGDIWYTGILGGVPSHP